MAEKSAILVNRVVKPSVAYFCMEYGIQSKLTTYSGGLGILAGDIVKEAHDTSLPLYSIGILWNQGYMSQVPYDAEKVEHHETRKGSLADARVALSVTIFGEQVKLRAFRHKTYPKMFFLEPVEGRFIQKYTSKLYQGSPDVRLAQEIILGVGGVRLLRALGILVDIYHFNEGHAVFAGIELICEQMATCGMHFDQAWGQVKNHIVFTTHTPVAAGNEVHQMSLVRKVYDPPLDDDQLFQIGGVENMCEFSMTVAGLRLSYITNAVSEIHAQTAREMWANVKGASEIIAITNGVHQKTWQTEEFRLQSLSEEDIKSIHRKNKDILCSYIRNQSGPRRVKWPTSTPVVIGFARRSVQYKRSTLIFRQLDKLEPFLENGRLKIVFAGKAHPNDNAGRDLLLQIEKYVSKYRDAIAFLYNYDMKIGKLITSGVDIWLNNPIFPQEACGTSGMKAAMNGVVNLSIADGWWPEGCVHGVNGWIVPGKKSLAAKAEVLVADVPSTQSEQTPTEKLSQDEKKIQENKKLAEEAKKIADKKEAQEADARDEADSLAIVNIILDVLDNSLQLDPMRGRAIEMATAKFTATSMMEKYYALMYSRVPENAGATKFSPHH